MQCEKSARDFRVCTALSWHAHVALCSDNIAPRLASLLPWGHTKPKLMESSRFCPMVTFSQKIFPCFSECSNDRVSEREKPDSERGDGEQFRMSTEAKYVHRESPEWNIISKSFFKCGNKVKRQKHADTRYGRELVIQPCAFVDLVLRKSCPTIADPRQPSMNYLQ